MEQRSAFQWLGEPDWRLPSGESAGQLVSGDLGALPRVLWHSALRAVLVGLGMYAAMNVASVKKLPTEDLVKYAVGGALGIETFILGWAALKKYGGGE